MNKVYPISAFQDNYIWLIVDETQKFGTVVDPGDAKPVLKTLEKRGIQLTSIFVTHHHSDHAGGIEKLLQRYSVPVFGPEGGHIPGVTHGLKEGATISVPGLGIYFSILEIPGHTLDHIAFVGENCLFCGDTLFLAGCGRLFEGSAAQMLSSLNKLAELPEETLVYCGHEYTLKNLEFAATVEPNNRTLLKRLENVRKLRKLGEVTVPASLKLEKETNPFLRYRSEEIIQTAASKLGHQPKSDENVFACIREMKDHF